MLDEIKGIYKDSKGGTEQMYHLFESLFSEDELKDYQVICSRVRKLLPDKKRILWLHDMVEDPENLHMQDKNNHNVFHAFVFVSETQKAEYIQKYDLPLEKCFVIKNCVKDIPDSIVKNCDCLNFIYHTTPHRGLHILVPVFQKLCEDFPDIKMHLNVFSSFAAYGWKDRDEDFKGLFQEIDNDKNITNHGFQENSIVREYLKKSHVFAFPSVWKETSCIAMMEALLYGVYPIYTNYGALPETTLGCGSIIPASKDHNFIANMLYESLKQYITTKNNKNNENYLNVYKEMYSVDRFKNDWKNLFSIMEMMYVRKS